MPHALRSLLGVVAVVLRLAWHRLPHDGDRRLPRRGRGTHGAGRRLAPGSGADDDDDALAAADDSADGEGLLYAAIELIEALVLLLAQALLHGVAKERCVHGRNDHSGEEVQEEVTDATHEDGREDGVHALAFVAACINHTSDQLLEEYHEDQADEGVGDQPSIQDHDGDQRRRGNLRENFDFLDLVAPRPCYERHAKRDGIGAPSHHPLADVVRHHCIAQVGPQHLESLRGGLAEGPTSMRHGDDSELRVCHGDSLEAEADADEDPLEGVQDAQDDIARARDPAQKVLQDAHDCRADGSATSHGSEHPLQALDPEGHVAIFLEVPTRDVHGDQEDVDVPEEVRRPVIVENPVELKTAVARPCHLNDAPAIPIRVRVRDSLLDEVHANDAGDPHREEGDPHALHSERHREEPFVGKESVHGDFHHHASVIDLLAGDDATDGHQSRQHDARPIDGLSLDVEPHEDRHQQENVHDHGTPDNGPRSFIQGHEPQPSASEDRPEEHRRLVEVLLQELPHVLSILGRKPPPVLLFCRQAATTGARIVAGASLELRAQRIIDAVHGLNHPF
mmetsp:Transcript_8244/g.30121  ORF Transcript_8244/g.30121 Transcript_8244/m.30121 type:complete len:565 (-) Transcript_8244:325-2019(-)